MLKGLYLYVNKSNSQICKNSKVHKKMNDKQTVASQYYRDLLSNKKKQKITYKYKNEYKKTILTEVKYKIL